MYEVRFTTSCMKYCSHCKMQWTTELISNALTANVDYASPSLPITLPTTKSSGCSRASSAAPARNAPFPDINDPLNTTSLWNSFLSPSHRQRTLPACKFTHPAKLTTRRDSEHNTDGTATRPPTTMT